MASLFEATELYDNALLGILQHGGDIQSFLNVVFGFLYRKTDFYQLLYSPSDKLGFPPGVAEKMVLEAFKTFEKMADCDRKLFLTHLRPKEESLQVPDAVQETEVTSEPCGETGELNDVAIDAAGDSQDPDDPPPAGAASRAAASDSDSYNGAVRENYSWSQDYHDLEVRVCVPKTVMKGRQVTVNLKSSAVEVSVMEGGHEIKLMQGEFTHRINVENSLWSLEPGKCVVLSLSKNSEVWWSALLEGEEEIDVNRINRERSMETVDEEEHAVLDRLSFDYQQKLQGKPQSHEKKVHEMLQKGWDAEGSPFKGQEFDPSLFDIPSSSVQF